MNSNIINTRRALLKAGTALVIAPAFLMRTAQAANYPSGPVSMMVPYPAGGPSDVSARILSEPIRMRALTRSEEHTSELQSLMRNSYAVLCLKKKTHCTFDDERAQHRQQHRLTPFHYIRITISDSNTH